MMEHRVGTRVKVETRSQLRSADGLVCDAVVRNASLSGAFMETGARLPLLSRVAVRPVAKDEWLEACVVRQDDRGLAVEWLDHGVHAVHALLAAKAASTPAAQRELSALESSIQEEAVARARSEVVSGEFDLQG
jgi:hypothetical protein